MLCSIHALQCQDAGDQTGDLMGPAPDSGAKGGRTCQIKMEQGQEERAVEPTRARDGTSKAPADKEAGDKAPDKVRARAATRVDVVRAAVVKAAVEVKAAVDKDNAVFDITAR